MAVTPYQEKKYVQSDAVTQAQQALQNHGQFLFKLGIQTLRRFIQQQNLRLQQ